jgi:TPR repeat protein
MEDLKRLNSAKDHIRNGRIDEGLQECLELVELGSAEAPDYLGVLYYSGLGVPEDKQKAEEYFLIAHNRGHAMGTYHLAGEYRKKAKVKESVQLSKSIARINPSAAYWTFRGLCELEGGQKGLETEAETYLLLAAKMGHIEALITIAKRTVRGYYGIRRIPKGIIQSFQITSRAREAIKKRERFKYIDSLHRRGYRQLEDMTKKQSQASP